MSGPRVSAGIFWEEDKQILFEKLSPPLSIFSTEVCVERGAEVGGGGR